MPSELVTLTLPYPPTVNHYWGRNFKTGKTYIKREGTVFRRDVFFLVAQAGAKVKFTEPVTVTARFWMPDKRNRDIDNLLKALLDALQHAGVYKDDNQIHNLHVHRLGVEAPGSVIVNVQEFSDDSVRK